MMLSASQINVGTVRAFIKAAVFAAVFTSLLFFTIASFWYMYQPAPSQLQQGLYHATENFTAHAIGCSFPVSGQYGLTAQWVYYVALAAVIFLRGHTWLSAGAAASAMTYSGVAALHTIIMDAGGSRWGISSARADYRFLHFTTTNGSITQLPICPGIYEADDEQAAIVTGAGLLAALPMSAWSASFSRHEAKAILMAWLLLIAIGHSLSIITFTDANIHYQICPSGYVEALPGQRYDAPQMDESWINALQWIVYNVTTSSTASCLYSCFATPSYLGRRTSEISIFDSGALEASLDTSWRSTGIAFWALYAAFAAVILILRLKRTRSGSVSAFRLLKKVRHARKEGSLSQALACNIADVIEVAIQFISAAAFVGFIFFTQFTSTGVDYDEDFDAVGQWGVLATLLMIIAAAVMGRFAGNWLLKPISVAADAQALDDDMLEEKDMAWGVEIGYAS